MDTLRVQMRREWNCIKTRQLSLEHSEAESDNFSQNFISPYFYMIRQIFSHQSFLHMVLWIINTDKD